VGHSPQKKKKLHMNQTTDRNYYYISCEQVTKLSPLTTYLD